MNAVKNVDRDQRLKRSIVILLGLSLFLLMVVFVFGSPSTCVELVLDGNGNYVLDAKGVPLIQHSSLGSYVGDFNRVTFGVAVVFLCSALVLIAINYSPRFGKRK